MTSRTQWTWVWANSRRWWRTGKSGVLQSMGLQRVGHDSGTKQHHYISMPSGSRTISTHLRLTHDHDMQVELATDSKSENKSVGISKKSTLRTLSKKLFYNVKYIQWFKQISRIIFQQRFCNYNIWCSEEAKDWVSSDKYLLYMKSSFICHIGVLNSTLHWETQRLSTLTAFWTNLRPFWKILIFRFHSDQLDQNLCSTNIGHTFNFFFILFWLLILFFIGI